MSHSLPGSFNPFATHPFTNNSGVVPPPPQPSPYPIPIPASRSGSSFLQSHHTSPGTSVSPSSPPVNSSQSSSPMKAPQPQRGTPASPLRGPIFEPFRQETSSPDLVLKKKPKSKNEKDTEPPLQRS